MLSINCNISSISRLSLVCLLLFSFMPQTGAEELIWEDTDWTGGAFTAAEGIDTDNYPGALILRNQPERMICIGEPTEYRGIYGITAYHDTLFICAGPYPAHEDGADVICYDYLSEEFSPSYAPYEQGVMFPKVFGDTLYIAGIDSRHPHVDGGAIFLYTGHEWICKQTVPDATHVFDLVKHDGLMYVTASNLQGGAGVLRSENNGDSFTSIYTFNPEEQDRWVYAITAWQDKIIVQPDGNPPEEDMLLVFDGQSQSSLPAPGLPTDSNGQFTAYGDSLIFTVGTKMYIYHDQDCYISDLPYWKDRWGRGIHRYNGSLYGGGVGGDLHRWTPATGWLPDPTSVVLDSDTELIEAVCTYCGRFFIGSSRLEGFLGGRLYMSLADPWGSLESTVHDFGMATEGGTVWWQADLVNDENRVRCQIRSADNATELSNKRFTGPDGTTSSFYETPGESLHAIHSGHCFFQYRIVMTCPDGIRMPIVRSVSLRMNGGPPADIEEQFPPPPPADEMSPDLGLKLRVASPINARDGMDIIIVSAARGAQGVPESDLHLMISDPQGRLLWQQRVPWRRGQQSVCRWDCRTTNGRPLEGGVYYLVLKPANINTIIDSRPLLILP